MRDVPGIIYLLHFAQPFKHARHYIGWTENLEARLKEHAAGSGARLLAVLKEHGISWELARTWTGTRNDERRLKQRNGAARFCPLCGVKPVVREFPTIANVENITQDHFTFSEAGSMLDSRSTNDL